LVFCVEPWEWVGFSYPQHCIGVTAASSLRVSTSNIKIACDSWWHLFYADFFMPHLPFFALSLLSLSTLFFKSVDMWSNSSRSNSKFNSILRVGNQIKFFSSAWDNILDMQVVTYKEQIKDEVILFKSRIKELHH